MRSRSIQSRRANIIKYFRVIGILRCWFHAVCTATQLRVDHKMVSVFHETRWRWETVWSLWKKKKKERKDYAEQIFARTCFFFPHPSGSVTPFSKVYAQLLRNVCFTQTYSRFKRESFTFCLEMNKRSKLRILSEETSTRFM